MYSHTKETHFFSKEFRLQSGLEALDFKEQLLKWAHNGFPNSVDFKQMKDAVLSPKTNECLNCIKEHMRSSFPSSYSSSSSSFSLDSPNAVEKKKWELKASSLMAARDGKCDIETLCIACDRSDCEAVSPHPYFCGGICGKCKEEADDAVMTHGDDGIYIFCAVCGGAGEVLVCDAPQCERVFCIGCVELLVSPAVAQHIIEIDPWQCFLCEPYHPDTHGLLKPRPDWKKKVFDRSDIRHTSNVPDVEDDTPDASSFPNRPLRVLSIFDGIGTG
ncbi:DNA (cytosine-5)-methyltransferase 3C-like [Panulirus ornatus]|uniref:DNA (cytosine-5)-methyltransferase 3C-like n=1 Tax=Panulirus ornatus TaxID=150431 RepID=UPI003A846164